jgi:hypothetical protein
MSFHIDPRDGLVTLPIGCVLSVHLSQNEFRSGKWFEDAKMTDMGTQPFVYYDFSGGEVAGKKLLVRLYFYDQMLLSIELTVCFKSAEAGDCSNYPANVEVATKRFHEELLGNMFGKPTHWSKRPSQLPPSQATLDQACMWQFAWGIVGSYHDPKGGGTFIQIKYGNRHEEANKAYRALMKGAA